MRSPVGAKPCCAQRIVIAAFETALEVLVVLTLLRLFFVRLFPALLIAAAVSSASAAPCPQSTVDPSVTICTPANNATVTSPVRVVAGTNDSQPVTLMQI